MAVDVLLRKQLSCIQSKTAYELIFLSCVPLPLMSSLDATISFFARWFAVGISLKHICVAFSLVLSVWNDQGARIAKRLPTARLES